ncbi:triose-phosphate transporter family-domain-containing protein [Mycotypha africana]|uniref:triose-phosphate transporter family-domain-containing protein n=1 Tax=Mycotypha africana TaxID=64632 RepID=UPI002301D06A|nr:triose-phosphate transporter family-domain-containing protein [Mycotypha africana]KAI8969033.1 triose-phosphate transporter family-domain-containing protein [Mycotypha africana]
MSKNGPSHSLSLSDNTKFLLCCFCWYLSSSLSSNTGKQIMNHFRYPVTLTYVQFIFVACWSAIAEKAVNMKNIRKPTKVIIQTIIPLSIFMIVGHVFSSISISRIPVSLVHTIKALAPLFTVLFYRFIFKVHYSSKVYTALIPLTTGVILACSFTFSNNLIGLLCALASCLIFVLQNIFSKKLLFKESKKGSSNPNKLDKMNMMFYSAFIAFVLMTPMWFYYDGFHILFNQANRDISRTKLLYYFLLNGTTHFAQNWFAFTTLSMSSPVTYSIASLVKRIFVIVMSIIWFGQQVSLIQSLGIILTFVGLWMYQSAKREVDQGESKACERSIDVLPTSNKGQDAEEILLNEKSHLPNSNALNNPAMTMKKWIGNHIPGSNTARNVKLL